MRGHRGRVLRLGVLCFGIMSEYYVRSYMGCQILGASLLMFVCFQVLPS